MTREEALSMTQDEAIEAGRLMEWWHAVPRYVNGKPRQEVKRGFVYVLLFPDGGTYVGYTRRTLQERWGCGSSYLNCSNKWMQNAVRSFNWEQIIKYSIHVPNEGHGLLIESLLIWALESNTGEGYNVQNGSDRNCLTKPCINKLCEMYPDIKQICNSVKLYRKEYCVQ